MLMWMLACTDPLDTGDTATDTGVGEVPAGLDYTDGNFLYQREVILDFAIEFDDEARASLDADPKEDVHATFRFGSESYEVGLHLKGSASGSFRTLDEKAGLKVDFHEWDPDASFHGVRRLTLNNMIQDSTMSHDHAAYEIFSRLGVPCARHGYANVTINGELYGLYGIAETMDEQWVTRTFPDDDNGNLYEGGYGGDLSHGREDNFDIKEQDDVLDYADLTALIDAIEAAPAGDILPVIEAEFDSDRLFAMWATELVIADDDGYLTRGNNFMVYHAPIADRWTMIPWGPDQSFEDELELWFEYDGNLALACLADAACVERIATEIVESNVALADPEFVAFVDAETARVEADCRADPKSEWGDYGCRDALAEMREWVRARPAIVSAMLAE